MKPLINHYLLPPKFAGGQIDIANLDSRLLNDQLVRPGMANSRRKFSHMDDNFLVLGL